jgi:hypothetical protein
MDNPEGEANGVLNRGRGGRGRGGSVGIAYGISSH